MEKNPLADRGRDGVVAPGESTKAPAKPGQQRWDLEHADPSEASAPSPVPSPGLPQPAASRETQPVCHCQNEWEVE